MSGLANNCIIIKTIMKKIKLSKFPSFIELNCLSNNLFWVYCFNSQMHHTDNIQSYTCIYTIVFQSKDFCT